MKKDEYKKTGQVFTPKDLVKDMLNLVKYKGKNILKKHIIDNSCGNGAFICEIVKRYINAYLKENGSLLGIETELSKYIHGIDIDENSINECINNLNEIIAKKNIPNVNWDIYTSNALSNTCFNGKMDYVVANPPYVRVHNLEDSYKLVKKFSFAKNGMTDLFIVFFEIGFNQLNNTGKMVYISPNSYYSSIAGKELRNYIIKEKNLYAIMELGHYTPFAQSTYTSISAFDKSLHLDKIKFYKYNSITQKPKFIRNIPYSEFIVNDNFIFVDAKFQNTFSSIYNINTDNSDISVKNAFATLNDSIFIKDNFEFKENVIDILKISTGEWKKCIFPYTTSSKPIKFENIKDEKLKKYFNDNKQLLQKRSIDNNVPWYCFGRTQAISDVSKNKIAINTTIKDFDSIKLNLVPAGSGLYSGLYITSNKHSFDEIKNAIYSNEFLEYIKALNKCKSGGYFTFSSSDLKKYLVYKLENVMDNNNFLDAISDSFKEYLNTEATSNKKLIILHGRIAKHLNQILGNEYSVCSLGIGDSKEKNLIGKYGEKKVDISIFKNDKPVAAIGVKFIMSNYAQNSNNYFENMLGETANLRSNNLAYFELVILPSHPPYFENNNNIIKKVETISADNLKKYINLSNDNPDLFMHIPNKTLLYLVDFPPFDSNTIKYKDDYINYYKNIDVKLTPSLNNYQFGNSIIYNDYEKFINEIINYCKNKNT